MCIRDRVTGYDIIGFWVSRMIFSGLAYTGKAPFDTVLIHGIVRDRDVYKRQLYYSSAKYLMVRTIWLV